MAVIYSFQHLLLVLLTEDACDFRIPQERKENPELRFAYSLRASSKTSEYFSR